MIRQLQEVILTQKGRYRTYWDAKRVREYEDGSTASILEKGRLKCAYNAAEMYELCVKSIPDFSHQEEHQMHLL
jgi:hypothetical protein